MFGIRLSQHARQLKHLLSCSAAGHVFPSITTVEVCGQEAEGLPLTLVADNLIIKLTGISSGFT
jgi:hypothetical protein